MRIIISSRAKKELKKLPKVDQIAIAKKIRTLTNLYIFNDEKLSGFKYIYRVRVGDYRIVYKKTNQEIFIVLIRHRKDVYHLINQMLK